MEPRSTRWNRLCATAASFTLFGLGGLLLGLIVIPILIVLPGGPSRRRLRSRALVQRSFLLFMRFMRVSGVLDFDFRRTQGLGRPGQLIVANHPTLIDVVMILAYTPIATCVVKASLMRNVFMRVVLRAAGFIPNVPVDEMIERAAAALDDGECLVMFPEGTRSRPGESLVFNRGAAAVAVRAAKALTPVFITCEPSLLAKGVPWYRVPDRQPLLIAWVGDDLDLSRYREMPAPRASRELNAALQALYAQGLAIGRGYNGTQGQDRP